MEDPYDIFPGEPPLQAYLELAERYYHDDRLDLAMKVVRDAFERSGWRPGTWTAFYNEIVCESDARAASDPQRLDERLTIETPRTAPPEVAAITRRVAVESREAIAGALGVDWNRPVTVTIFLPDAAVDFIVGSYGYVSHKTGIDKICLPYHTVESRREASDALLHEFAHVATFELAQGEPPEWLDEGIATHFSHELSSRQARFVISTAARTGRMLSLRRIDAILNDSDERKDRPEMVDAAYFLSGSFVEFWVSRHGMGTVRAALLGLRNTDHIDRAIRRATGERLSAMEREWRRRLVECAVR